MAGVLALLEHVEAFNAGALFLEDDPFNWSSMPMLWPGDTDEHEVHLFGYSVLANVRRALAAQAVQS